MNTFPIIFSGAMVRALLKGQKTQTRRIPTPTWRKVAPGDLLYVRETLARAETDQGIGYATFAANARDLFPPVKWQWKNKVVPSIHMPRWASRLTLEVTDVREQQLHAITWGDVAAEGICEPGAPGSQHFEPFIELWDSLHGKKPGEAWADNPTVIALTFQVHRENIDHLINDRKRIRPL